MAEMLQTKPVSGPPRSKHNFLGGNGGESDERLIRLEEGVKYLATKEDLADTNKDIAVLQSNVLALNTAVKKIQADVDALRTAVANLAGQVKIMVWAIGLSALGIFAMLGFILEKLYGS